MRDRFDPRPAVTVTLAPLAGDPRLGLEAAATLPVRGVQLSALQLGTRPRDLDRSGRRDLLAAARRRELEIAGIDLWFPSEDLLEPGRVDDAVDRLHDTVQLAADLGRVAVSTRFPNAGADDPIRALLAVAARLGVTIIDHAVPPRGRPVRARSPRGSVGSGLILPGSEDADAEVSTSSVEVAGLAVGIDTPAWLVAGLDFLDAASRGVEAIRLSDLTADGMRIPPGDPDGRVDPGSLIAVARTGGFEGLPVIDARRWPRPIDGVRVTLEHLGWSDA
jgi:hypothetical protein